MRIGFFDSGLGGLTILRSVVRTLPQYDYLYYGDTAHLPYGDRTEAEIFELSKRGIEWLFARDCVLVIIACNTASAETLRRLQDEWLPETYPDRRILGVIVPMVEAVLEANLDQVTLLATKRTVDSRKYEIELQNRAAQPIALQARATPELVPLIERNELAAAAAKAESYLEGGEGAVVLGCTHYTELKEALRTALPQRQIISPDEVVPAKLTRYLDAHPEIASRVSATGKRDVHLTAHRADYDRIMGHFLGGVYIEED